MIKWRYAVLPLKIITAEMALIGFTCQKVLQWEFHFDH